MAGVLNDTLHRPVEMSHILTTPPESLVIAILLSACRLTDSAEAEPGGVEFGSLATGPIDEAPICQNLTDLS